MPWYVLYTNPKAEKKVAQQLAAMGFEVYCPVVKQVRQWSDRKKVIEVPLFTSYIFINTDESRRHEAFNARGAVRYLFWLGKPAVVKQAEITEIREWLNSQAAISHFDIVKEGDEIEIQKGHFKGQTGTVQQITKNYIRLVIDSIGFTLVIKTINKEEQPGKSGSISIN